MHVGDWFTGFGKLYLMQRFANECFTLETCNFVDILVRVSEISSKVSKIIMSAMERYASPYDIAVILKEDCKSFIIKEWDDDDLRYAYEFQKRSV